MTKTLKSVVFPVIFLLLSHDASRAQEKDVDSVGVAISSGSRYLLSIQHADGHWESVHVPAPAQAEPPHSVRSVQWLGRTALATYALLAAGESPQEPRLVKAIEFLKANQATGTYALAMRCMVWMYLPRTDDTLRRARADADALLRIANPQGLHTYFAGATDLPDTSNSQMAALGLWAAGEVGVEVPKRYWEAANKTWRQLQLPDGGWPYRPGAADRWMNESNQAMTPAAVATLLLMRERLAPLAGADCKPLPVDVGLEKGLAAVAAQIEGIFKYDVSGDRTLYAMYMLERAGMASGYRRFGGTDWYERGAKFLLSMQQPDGRWSHSQEDVRQDTVGDTSLALLFLAYGRAPVAMTKLKYGIDGKQGVDSWNNRPGDVASITRWMGRQREQLLGWQIDDLSGPVEALDDSPILFIGGDRAPVFTDEQKQKLRAYIDRGGLIVANPDCGSKAFAASMQKLAAELYPGHELARLPASHPIYTRQQFKLSSPAHTQLMSIGNGVRELFILLPPVDAPRGWLTAGNAPRDVASRELMANLLQYATGSERLLFRGQTTHPGASQPGGRVIKIARVLYGVGDQPEPGAWFRQAEYMSTKSSVRLDVQDVKLNELPSKHEIRVAHITGLSDRNVEDRGIDDLAAFIHRGGTLIVDSAGGGSTFSDLIEHRLQQRLADAATRAVPADAPVWKRPIDLSAAKWRAASMMSAEPNQADGIIREMTLKGRATPAAYFCRSDVSAGMAGVRSDGINGLTPEWARKMMANLILHASE